MSESATPTLPLVPSDEERQVRDAVAGICAGFGPEYIRRCHEANEPPRELWDALAEKGYLGVNLPERYGGGGQGMQLLQAVGEEISAAGCSLLLIVVSPAIAGSILVRHGTEAQRERWVPGIAAGTTRIAFAITEPDAGTNSHNLSTAARRVNGGYSLRGTKVFISGIEDSEAILVIARKREEDGSLGLPLLLIVDVDAPGLDKQAIPMALRGADRQWQLYFDDVEVPADRVIGESEEVGLKAAFDGLNPERIMGAALSTGVGRRALDLASEYARERVVWSGPIGAHQGVSHPLAQAKIELELARVMTQKAAALYDAGAPAGEAANMAKYAAAEAAIHCVDQAIQTHGGNGFALEYGLTDLYWGARVGRTAPVSREMVLNYVAEHSLGLPRSADARVSNLDHIRSYYEALNTGDPDRVAEHFTDDATHYYTRLGPHEGARTIGEMTKAGVEVLQGQWYIEHGIESGDEAVIEWTMTWLDPNSGEKRLDRGTEWFQFRDGRIAEIRAYHHGGRKNPQGDLLGFDHAGRGHTTMDDWKAPDG